MQDAVGRYVNGYSYGGVRLEVADLAYSGKDNFTKKQQHEAILNDRMLSRRLKGTVRLIDEETNKVLDVRKNFTLAKVPYLTERNTFIDNGSEFSPIMQSRLLPGAYTRRRDNGELETHFNTRPGTGSAMRVTFDPVSTQYRLKVGSSNLHAYSVFHEMGVSDEELERRWGPEILAANKAKYSKDTISKLYKKAIPKWERDETADVKTKIESIRAALDRAQVSDKIIRQNLPNLFNQEKAASWRALGRAHEVLEEMTKESNFAFAPDFTPDQMIEQWAMFEAGMVKQAEFKPDYEPDELREAYNSIYGKSGPQLASMREWPKHWLDDQDNQGWLQWYENYSDGRRGDTDDKQIKRWKSFKARHGKQFQNKPTPRRAYALVNWGIDPLKLIDDDDTRERVAKEMEQYRRKEYMKWYLNRHDFADHERAALARKARSRGAEGVDMEPTDGQLMTLALDGHIEPEDLK